MGWITIVVVPLFAAWTMIWHRRRFLQQQQQQQQQQQHQRQQHQRQQHQQHQASAIVTDFENWKNVTLPEQSLWTGIQSYQRHPTLPIFTFVNNNEQSARHDDENDHNKNENDNGSTMSSSTCTGLGDPATMIEIHRRFVPRSTDVHIVTYPKAGTSWIQEVTWLINHNADVVTTTAVPSSQRTVYIELRTSDIDKLSQLESLPVTSPRHIKWHHSSDLLPKQIVEEGSNSSGKIIYLLRNPKDIVVSWYHFQRNLPLYGFVGDFAAFLDLFLQGHVAYGCYWHNVLSWWKVRHQSNVLFLAYEEMQTNLTGVVHQIASFLSQQLTPQQVAVIVEHCQFEQMKNNHPTLTSNIMWRKGQVGDWRNYLSENQNRRMDRWIEDHHDVGSSSNSDDERLPLIYELT